MGFPSWCLSFLYLIIVLSDVFIRSMEFPEYMVSDSEIVNLVKQFRQQDVNKAANEQIILDYQRHTTVGDSSDKAEQRFFKRVDPALLERNTYKKWIALSNEFVPEAGIEEKNTPEKNKAIDEFLDAAFNTSIWRNLFHFMNDKGHPYAVNLKTFRIWIRHLWFGGYSRKMRLIDSSGFEHVFMGEYNDNSINGMHSWIRFYLLERNASQQLNYHGYIIKRFNFMAAVKFSWRNHVKRVTSFFIGTSPEFDLALYTLCFLTRQSRNTCKFELEGCPFLVTSYNFKQQGKNFIGTIYPISGPFTNKCRQYNSY
ncbi:unnamed protein product [Cercopithifilaria johnstoni]|uniref:EndoU domain-containing protein n=1 Tax=Cercopithifilaria johnstoni TaxID=2874296 RepID=A0A8J2MLP0_9BILA|nr:unnamed protein product [Cercopithifilaria johnstoni]